MSELEFVNFNGDPLPLVRASVEVAKLPKKRRPEVSSYHKGWRVEGVSKAALEAAREVRAKAIREAEEWNRKVEEGKSRGSPKRVPPPLDEAQWISGASTKAVRSRPFEVRSAAEELAALALKSGDWLRVHVRELKREVPGK